MNGFRVVCDKLLMHVKLIPGEDLLDAVYSEEELLSYFAARNIFKGIDNREILRAFVELPHLPVPIVYTVAQGKKPEHGENGRLDFKMDISGKAKYFAPTEDDDDLPVDYKSAIGLPVVSSGECLCEVIPPTAGVAGYDVSGKVLPARDGKEVPLMLGEGVVFSSDQTRIFATRDGRPVYENNKVSVSEIYEVRGDVCFRTGNIHFNGHVIIHGSVQDTFSVEAESVEIKGCVEDAFIKADEELIIYGGALGKYNQHGNAGYIKCRGNVLVKYLNDVNIEVDGDLIVRKEIVNSTVKCAGRVKAACIIGGTVTAFKGVEAAVVGSEMGIPTVIQAGISYHLKYYEEALAALSWQIDSLLESVKALFDNQEAYRTATKLQQKRFIAEYDNFMGIRDGYLELIDKRLEQIEREKGLAVCEVIVMKHMYTDIILETPNSQKRFINEYKGPLLLAEDSRDMTIHISSYSTCNVHGHNREQELRRENRNNLQYQYMNMDKVRLHNSQKVIYTRRGIRDLEQKFLRTINEQNFCVGVFEDRHTRRITLINALKKAGIANVYGIKDVFEALEFVKELEDKNMVIICNLHVGAKDGVKFVSNMLHKAPNNFGIILVDKVIGGLQEAVSKIRALELFHENVSPEEIIEQIRKFGLDF